MSKEEVLKYMSGQLVDTITYEIFYNDWIGKWEIGVEE